MSLDGFLTFIGLLITSFAVLRPSSKLRLFLNSWRQFFWGIVAFALVLILQFLNIFSDGSTFGDGRAEFIVVLIWGIGAYCLFKLAQPNIYGLRKLYDIVVRLHDEGRMLELIEVTERYLPVLQKVRDRKISDLAWHGKWKSNLRDSQANADEYLALKGSNPWVCDLGKPIMQKINGSGWMFETSENIIDVLLNSDRLREVLLTKRADFALELIKLSRRSYEGFVPDYLSELVQTPNSIFYREIYALNDNREEQAVLLNGFLNDASFAELNSAWKPVGDTVIEIISTSEDYRSNLNLKPPKEAALWDDPTFCSITYFYCMVRSAAEQNVTYAMWLTYTRIFVEELVKSYDPKIGVVETDEFPTLSCRLIYELLDLQLIWLSMIVKLKESDPQNVHISKNGSGNFETWSIPFQAAEALTDSLKAILWANNMPKSFKSYILEVFIRRLPKLFRDDEYFKPLVLKLLGDLQSPPLGVATADWEECHHGVLSDIDVHLTFEYERFVESLS